MNWFKRVGDAFSDVFSRGNFAASADRKPRQFHIAILSFDRPDYLVKVLKSLRPQLSANDRVTLFQDGPNGPDRKSKAGIRACVSAFKKLVPWGRIELSKSNLGIALNYERAETHVFENLKEDACLLLEDDLVLSPNFVDVTTQLLSFAQSDNRIGYVSACGNLWASRAEQMRKASLLVPMHENWGAAITRTAWLAEREFRLSYLDLLRDTRYEKRDHTKIKAFYAARGWDCKFTSQDASRWISCLERGVVRVTTFACHAKYIGEYGVHFTPELYSNGGFANTEMFEGPLPELVPPSARWMTDCLEAERRRFTGGGMPFYPTHGT